MLDPRHLAAHYQHFQVGERVLLTGHSHQAWPDCSLQAQTQAWLDAASLVDDKWEVALQKADLVRQGFARLLEDTDGEGQYSLAPNTHDLLIRLLSALPYRTRPKIVSTDAEFHSLSRQLHRLREEGIEVVLVPALPSETVAQRLADAVDERTAAVIVSAVFFDSGQRALHLGELASAVARVGAELVIDAYHALGVVPFPLASQGLQQAFVLGGGYKYCQLGEGNCFLRFPSDCELRPVLTGWFADFGALAAPRDVDAPTNYGPGGQRFAGSTYDPVSHYRAAAVFDFFEREGMTAAALRELSQRQLGRLTAGFDALHIDPAVVDRPRDVPLERLGGFLTLRTPIAGQFRDALRARGVHTDYRGTALRLGPAPYVTDEQLDEAMAMLGEVAATVA